MRQFIIATILSTAAIAAQANDTIELRQGYFKLVKYEFGDVMGAMVQNKRPMDPERFAEAANRLNALAGVIDELFPAGSEGSDSRARAEIWSQPAQFQTAQSEFKAKVSALHLAVTSGDQGAVAAAFKATAGTCKACHDDFRSK